MSLRSEERAFESWTHVTMASSNPLLPRPGPLPPPLDLNSPSMSGELSGPVDVQPTQQQMNRWSNSSSASRSPNKMPYRDALPIFGLYTLCLDRTKTLIPPENLSNTTTAKILKQTWLSCSTPNSEPSSNNILSSWRAGLGHGFELSTCPSF